MKTRLNFILITVFFTLGIPDYAWAQQKAEPQIQMVEFHMALLKRGPQWIATHTPARKKLHDTDPAVQAGRLVIDMHPWLVPEGILP